VANDVGVRETHGEVQTHLGHAVGAVQRPRLHPTVPVPLGPTVTHADAVDHAIAGEPVHGGSVLRVGAVATIKIASSIAITHGEDYVARVNRYACSYDSVSRSTRFQGAGVRAILTQSPC
jgi:hypothetical protein